MIPFQRCEGCKTIAEQCSVSVDKLKCQGGRSQQGYCLATSSDVAFGSSTEVVALERHVRFPSDSDRADFGPCPLARLTTPLPYSGLTGTEKLL